MGSYLVTALEARRDVKEFCVKEKGGAIWSQIIQRVMISPFSIGPGKVRNITNIVFEDFDTSINGWEREIRIAWRGCICL